MGGHLLEEVSKLYVADLSEARIQEFIDANPGKDIEPVAVEDALYMDVDIVSPCAVGSLITKDNVNTLKCRYVWGSANNQIKAANPEEEIAIAELLAERDIMFQVEWWYNTGGVLCAAHEYLNGEEATYEKLIKYMDDNLPSTTWNNLTQAAELGITPTENAYKVCSEFIYS